MTEREMILAGIAIAFGLLWLRAQLMAWHYRGKLKKAASGLKH